jgi:hypothetical protein
MVEIKDGDLVMLRLESDYGFSNTWWRVLFWDTDGTFIGKLEKRHWLEHAHLEIGLQQTHLISKIQSVYKQGEQFCYSDNITICTCRGLCREK